MAVGQKYDENLNRDISKVKTPAFYDPNLDEWLTASANVIQTENGIFIYQKGTNDGRAKVDAHLTGTILAEQKTNADAVNNIITFTEDINAIEIYHEEQDWQDFVVNGIPLKIPPGGYRTPIGGTIGKTVTIPANVNCIVGRLV